MDAINLAALPAPPRTLRGGQQLYWLLLLQFVIVFGAFSIALALPQARLSVRDHGTPTPITIVGHDKSRSKHGYRYFVDTSCSINGDVGGRVAMSHEEVHYAELASFTVGKVVPGRAGHMLFQDVCLPDAKDVGPEMRSEKITFCFVLFFGLIFAFAGTTSLKRLHRVKWCLVYGTPVSGKIESVKSRTRKNRTIRYCFTTAVGETIFNTDLVPVRRAQGIAEGQSVTIFYDPNNAHNNACYELSPFKLDT